MSDDNTITTVRPFHSNFLYNVGAIPLEVSNSLETRVVVCVTLSESRIRVSISPAEERAKEPPTDDDAEADESDAAYLENP